MRLPGIGRETADCVLVYACDCHPQIVVDAYARRIFQRLGLFDDESHDIQADADYDMLQQFLHRHVRSRLELYEEFEFNDSVPTAVALARDYHGLIVELGRHHCLKTAPRCHVKGKHGWQDYDFCNAHCIHNGCTHCPLAVWCVARRRTSHGSTPPEAT